MIFDHIDNIEKYQSIRWLYDALKAMAPVTPESFSKGQVIIEKEVLFLNCNTYSSKPETECFFEAHKEYIDVHLMISGEELIGHTDESSLDLTQSYNSENDASLYQGNIQTTFSLKPGWFVVFMPGEPHLVGLQTGEQPVFVQKIVAKVAGHLTA